MEYPPIFPWLSTGVYLLSASVATGWGIELLYYAIIGLILVAAETALFVLVYKLASLLWKPPAPVHSLLIYGLLFLPYYFQGADRSTRCLPSCSWLGFGSCSLVSRADKCGRCSGRLLYEALSIALLPIAFCTITGWQKKFAYLFAFAHGSRPDPAADSDRPGDDAGLPFHVLLSRPPWETVWALVQGSYGIGVCGATV